ncbi:MAG: AAA family ATPase [Pseudomonadota bacterium]
MTRMIQKCTKLRQIALSNLLSFGPGMDPLVLENLNILIGPNGAGKSNLIEAVALMRAAPGDIRSIVRRGGGVGEWIWKGGKGLPATVDFVVDNPKGPRPLRHVLSFREEARVFRIEDERIENERAYENEDEPYFYYRFNQGQPMVNTIREQRRSLAHETVDVDRSILAQRRDPELYPELSYLAEIYGKVRIYREWAFGRNTVFREPQKADMRNDRLEEDFSNLGLVLNRLRRKPKAKAAILESLCDLYEGVTDFDVSIEGGTVQVFFTEGDFVIPATRLSDGALRYLCLLAILVDPSPPPLICIEEPELGLHPDILPKLADLMVAAAERTQLIVTTHSDILVDAMTERPETVVVCEKHDGMTRLRRLRKDELTVWLDKYRLGQLWTKGQIGGTRW